MQRQEEQLNVLIPKSAAMLLNAMMEGKTQVSDKSTFEVAAAEVSRALSNDTVKANVDKFLRSQDISRVPRSRRSRAEMLLSCILKA